MQVKHALFRQEKMVIAQLKGIKLLRVGLHLAHKAERQTNLRIGDRRTQAGFTQQTVPRMQVLFTAVDNADLPDQQYLRRVLQMRLVRAFKITDKLIPGCFTELIDHRLNRHWGYSQPFA